MIDIEKIQAKHIIFDLDGTLIDSAPAILDSFTKAFETCRRTPVVPLVPTLIGPPLMQIMAQLAGTDAPEVLNPLFEAFKANYDEAGYLQTTMFPGVSETLEELRRRGHVLYLATNKRIVPTQKIIEYLGWQDHFKRSMLWIVTFRPLKQRLNFWAELFKNISLVPMKHYTSVIAMRMAMLLQLTRSVS